MFYSLYAMYGKIFEVDQNEFLSCLFSTFLINIVKKIEKLESYNWFWPTYNIFSNHLTKNWFLFYFKLRETKLL